MLNAQKSYYLPVMPPGTLRSRILQSEEQAKGRQQRPDDNAVEPFHINELRFGVLNHRPYNLGWVIITAMLS
jgi:hypothetical protein